MLYESVTLVISAMYLSGCLLWLKMVLGGPTLLWFSSNNSSALLTQTLPILGVTNWVATSTHPGLCSSASCWLAQQPTSQDSNWDTSWGSILSRFFSCTLIYSCTKDSLIALLSSTGTSLLWELPALLFNATPISTCSKYRFFFLTPIYLLHPEAKCWR